MSRSFTAQYPGRCASCDEGIRVGDTLVYDADDLVIHVECRDNSSTLRKPAEICPRCFLAKSMSGECGCT